MTHNGFVKPECSESPSITRGRIHVLFSIALFMLLCFMWLEITFSYSETAWDFSQFYIVAHTPLSKIYDQQVIHTHGGRLLAPLGIHYFPPYVRPAVGVLPLRPLQFVDYWTAYWIFAAVQFTACLAMFWLAVRRLSVRAEILAAVALFYPAMMSIVTGQDILVVAFVAVAGLVALRNGDNLKAGLILGLTTYKYNLLLFVPVLLAVRRCWRSLAGWTLSAATLALVSVLLASPAAYIELLQSIEKYTVGFSPATMISLRGPLSGSAPWLYPPIALLVIAMAVDAMRRLPLEPAFYTGQIAALLVGYHVNWYDAALLLVPLVWVVAPCEPSPRTPAGLLGRIAAAILLVGTLAWPLGHGLVTLLIAAVFVMFCCMNYPRAL